MTSSGLRSTKVRAPFREKIEKRMNVRFFTVQMNRKKVY